MQYAHSHQSPCTQRPEDIPKAIPHIAHIPSSDRSPPHRYNARPKNQPSQTTSPAKNSQTPAKPQAQARYTHPYEKPGSDSSRSAPPKALSKIHSAKAPPRI